MMRTAARAPKPIKAFSSVITSGKTRLAGFLARARGVDAYYPPSPTALSYLKSMDEIGSQLGVIAVAQVFRGALWDCTLQFALITLTEVTVQSIILGLVVA